MILGLAFVSMAVTAFPLGQSLASRFDANTVCQVQTPPTPRVDLACIPGR